MTKTINSNGSTVQCTILFNDEISKVNSKLLYTNIIDLIFAFFQIIIRLIG